ncbi:hypothetical protein Hamer_G010797 [Homarus americanus]|uniref:Uncharacterized protein n=1 Tax=Homarus americanus TaxID=6706 RepID=A0A8J5JQB8_HOMAM|nr:hypothetical protein Hamer_G010797 [Homarus americanus]
MCFRCVTVTAVLDSRDRAKGAATKASLALQNVLALETGFTLDKESHTLGLLCKDVTLVVAFDTKAYVAVAGQDDFDVG